MAYAENTSVPIEKSIAEIITLIKRAGAVRIAQAEEPNGFAVQFFLADRMIRFRVGLPALSTISERMGNGQIRTAQQRRDRLEAVHRQRGRALLLVIKAKLESVENEVETFEQAFLANIVMHDGATVYERISAPIAAEYEHGTPQMLLDGPR